MNHTSNKYTITMPGAPPPRPGTVHWRNIHKAKNRWKEQVGFLALAIRMPKAKRGEKRNVHILFQRPGPRSDTDNAYAQAKIPLDALVYNGLLFDDSPEYCDLSVDTMSGLPSQTIITISTKE